MVDDDAEVRWVVRSSLESAHLTVIGAGSAQEALTAASQQPVDVAVLDLHLPDMSGLELMTCLRELDTGLPVLMLSGSASESDRVRGLVSGADDYVVKPFSAAELTARVIAAARRRRPPPTESIQVEGLRIDVAAREAFLTGTRLALTRREFDLLCHLARHRGQTFTRDELLRAVWKSSSSWQSETTVTEHVRRLRVKIEMDPAQPTLLVTVRGAGYRLDASVGTRGPAADLLEAGADVASRGEMGEVAAVVLVGEVLVDVNDAAARLFGVGDRSGLVGKSFFELIVPQSLGAAIAPRSITREHRWPLPNVITLRRLDGREVDVEVAWSPVLRNGRPASRVTLWELASDTSSLREIAMGVRTEVAEAVILTDLQLRIRSFNRAAESLFGWREHEVLGRNTMEMLPWVDGDGTYEQALGAFRLHGRWQGDVILRRRDGSTVSVRSSSTLLRDHVGAPVGFIHVNRPLRGSRCEQTVPATDDESLAEVIRRGIKKGEFVVHFQPVVRLEADVWVGAEALVRWQHPEQGLLMPNRFIDTAERSGAIVELGHLVLQKAAQQWTRWRDDGLDLFVSVNLSARQLADPRLIDRVAAVISEASLPAGTLHVEITESALVEDLSHAAGVLERLVALGVRVGIDDFGTGWASLTYLRQFPIHTLKIDREFVHGLRTSAPDLAIVRSILSLGAELGLDVIAEGIETADQHAALRELGCEFGQGYLYARPMPAHDFVLRCG